MRDGRDSSLNVVRIPPFLKRPRTELQMPSPTDDPLISPTSTNSTCGCLAGAVQFALGSNKRARLTIPTSTTSFALGTAAATNVQCRARGAPCGCKKSAADLNSHRPMASCCSKLADNSKAGTLVSLPSYFSHPKTASSPPTEHAATDPLMTTRSIAR